jgi:hypothetical protein
MKPPSNRRAKSDHRAKSITRPNQSPIRGPGRYRPHEMDGNAPGVSFRSKFPARRRTVRWLAAYNPSSSDDIGRRRAATATPTVYIRGALRLRSIAPQKEALHFALDLLQGSLQGLAPGIDDNRPLCVQPFQLKPHGFADTPLDPVAHNGLAERPGGCKSNARPAGFGLAKTERGEKRTGKARSFVIDSSEILRSQQADTFRKTWDGRLPFVADRELLTSTGTPASQYSAPILGFHAAKEPMGFSALAVIRLKSTFRHSSPII